MSDTTCCNNTSLPQSITIVEPTWRNDYTACCPLCGTPECAHLVFISREELHNYTYESDDFEKRFDRARHDDYINAYDDESFEEFLARLGYDDNLVVINIHRYALACGPVWLLDCFGYDFCPERIDPDVTVDESENDAE